MDPMLEKEKNSRLLWWFMGIFLGVGVVFNVYWLVWCYSQEWGSDDPTGMAITVMVVLFAAFICGTIRVTMEGFKSKHD